jgi:hypothetical protein
MIFQFLFKCFNKTKCNQEVYEEKQGIRSITRLQEGVIGLKDLNKGAQKSPARII